MIGLKTSRYSTGGEGGALEALEGFVVCEQDGDYLVRVGDLHWWMEEGTPHTAMVLTEEEILREFPLTTAPLLPTAEEVMARIHKSLGLSTH